MNRDRQEIPKAVLLRQENKLFRSESKQAVLIERNKPFYTEEEASRFVRKRLGKSIVTR
jgi:hypothetical protein